MAKGSREWFGGDNFVFAPQWGSGASNSGSVNKRYGNASTKRGRFNPNGNHIVNHPSCLITARAKRDKKKHMEQPRPVIVTRRKAS